MRDVHPPIFQGQLLSFHLGALNLLIRQEAKKKRQQDYNEKEKTWL